jgi:GNAT superfamily N-acetyltransferase
MSQYTVKTVRELGGRPDEELRISMDGLPEFMRHDPISADYFARLYTDFPDFQFVLYDDNNGETLAATCNSIPVIWDLDPVHLYDAGFDWALESGFHNLELKHTPTTLCALSITVAREYRGKGVSHQAIQSMKALAAQHGLNALIAPVRPLHKRLYPLIPMEHYMRWTRDDGAPFDPWIRTHWRIGGRIVKLARHSTVIPGTVAEWEQWTGLKFLESGDYVIEGALNPAYALLEADLVSYVEPNVWMHHSLDPQ